MNIGSLGIAGGAAAQGMQSRVKDAERVQQDNASTEREIKSADLAEQAEGIGVTHEEEAAGDRDADGRMQWERNEPQPPTEANVRAEASSTEALPQHAKDPTGQSGTILDLDG